MLDDETRANLLDQVNQDIAPGPSSNTSSVDAVQEVEVVDVKQETSTDPKVEEIVDVETSTEEVETSDDSTQPKGHKVPYSRFKNVLESRNQFRTEVATYKDKLTSLETKLQNLEKSQATYKQNPSRQPETQKTWLDDYLAGEQEAAVPEWQQQYTGINERLYKFEVAQEEQSLKAELNTISEKYPSVPHNVLLKAVIDDPNVDMSALAEQYSSFRAGIEEEAIARYLESQGGQAQAASPTPEPLQRPRSVSAARGTLAPEKRPTSVAGASSALRDLLSKNNFLKD
jgi:uncharacterized phage infection (PIP) family protein YhgE